MPTEASQHRPGPTLTPAQGLGLLLVGAFAVPLFFPPEARLPDLAASAPGLTQRLFPGVPGWWVLTRLLALAVGAVLLGRGGELPEPRPMVKAGLRSSIPLHLALCLALTLLGAAWLTEAAWFSRGLQITYVVGLGLPVAILALGSRSPRPSRSAKEDTGAAALRVSVVVACWLLWRGFASWHSLRGADAIDTWEGLESLEQAIAHGRNLLTSSRFVLMTDGNLFLQGLALVDLGVLPLSVELVQAFQLLWMALAGALLGLLAARHLSAAAAPVVTAALLFSPFALMIPIQTLPYSLGPPFAAGILLALDAAVFRRSHAGMVGLALLLGLSPWHPPVIPLAALASAIGFVVLMSRFPKRFETLAVALLLLVATVLPGWKNKISLDSFFQDASSSYASAGVSWSAGEWVLLGQSSLSETPIQAPPGRAGALDLPLGSVLLPFAMPRTPMRLLGDTLLDPAGACLAACGLVVCIGSLRRRRLAWFLPLVLGATLVTGFVSSYDRPSLTRLSAAPVAMALLAGVGFEALRRRLAAPALLASAVVTATIAAGGAILFDGINPRILPRSAVGIALASLHRSPPEGFAVLLRPDAPQEVGWRHMERIASNAPSRPVSVWSDKRVDPPAAAAEDLPELIFWSPRLESDSGVSHRLCRTWPAAALYVLRDETGLSRALAARPRGPGWDPQLPSRQWELTPCAEHRP